MSAAPPWVASKEWTRRALLAAVAASPPSWARGQEVAGSARTFLDPSTEFEVLQVTSTEHNSWLPYPENRCLTRRGDFLVFASDSGQSRQLYRHDIKANRVRTLTSARSLNPASFTLTAGDRSLLYFDGDRLNQTAPSGGRDRTIFEVPQDWTRDLRVAASESGDLAIAASNGTRTRIYRLADKKSTSAQEVEGLITSFAFRPKLDACSFVRDGSIYSVPSGETPAKAGFPTAKGSVLSASWAASGASILYLLRPGEPNRLIELREFTPETGADALISKTTQYGHFDMNADGGVFLGASLSKASPHLLILLRSARRELTLCEHRCSDAGLTRAVFAPNSSRIAFQTDRSGKMVVYSMSVDRLVDRSDDPESNRSGT